VVHAFLFYGSIQNIYLSFFASFLLSQLAFRSSGLYLVRYSPVVEPLQVAVLTVWTDHSPADWHEQDVKANGCGIQDTIDGVLHRLVFISQQPIGKKSKVEDGKVKGWVVVVDIGDTSHGDEWQVVEEPTKDWIKRRVVDLINIGFREVTIAPLPSDEVFPRRKYFTIESSHPHMRRPTWRIGHCQNCEARSSCLSGSGTSALFDVIMATFKWMKSWRKGDL
jgi:hypothetical protein